MVTRVGPSRALVLPTRQQYAGPVEWQKRSDSDLLGAESAGSADRSDVACEREESRMPPSFLI